MRNNILLAVCLILAGCISPCPRPVAKSAAPPLEAATSSTTWTATSSQPWLSVPSSGSGNSIAWTAQDNTSSTPRTAIITITVTQPGVSPAGPWAKSFGSPGADYGAAVAYDASGNVIVSGIFSGTVNFGGNDLVSAGSWDSFLAKFGPTGNHLWSKRFGGANTEIVESMALDASGNIFLGGEFVTGSLLKFSSQGDLLWTAGAPAAPFPNNAYFMSIATDSQGNIVATGNFRGTMDFGGVTLTSAFTSVDAFLAKYSPSGACLWAKAFDSGGGDYQYGNGVAVLNDNIFLTGHAFAGIRFGAITLSNPTYGAFGFLAKFTAAGDVLWARRLGTTQAGDALGPFARARRIALDSNGDIALSGEFKTKSQFAGEPMDGGVSKVLLGTSPTSDLFVAKYAADGRFLWALPVTGNQSMVPGAITADAQNNIIVTGYFAGTYSFGAQSLVSAGGGDGFVTKFSSAGVIQSAQRFGGPLEGDNGRGIAVDSQSIMVTGSFSGGNAGNTQLTSAGGQDVLVWKIIP